jgi:hypothetical protein
MPPLLHGRALAPRPSPRAKPLPPKPPTNLQADWATLHYKLQVCAGKRYSQEYACNYFLQVAAAWGSVKDVVKTLDQAGADVDAVTDYYFIPGQGQTPLCRACSVNSPRIVEMVELLLSRFLADPNVVARYDDTFFTPLHAAARNANVAVVRLLLAHGASPSVRDNNGHTPLELLHSGTVASLQEGPFPGLSPHPEGTAASPCGDSPATASRAPAQPQQQNHHRHQQQQLQPKFHQVALALREASAALEARATALAKEESQSGLKKAAVGGRETLLRQITLQLGLSKGLTLPFADLGRALDPPCVYTPNLTWGTLYTRGTLYTIHYTLYTMPLTLLRA